MTDIKHKPDNMTPEKTKPHPFKYDTPCGWTPSENSESGQREKATNQRSVPVRDDVIPTGKGGIN